MPNTYPGPYPGNQRNDYVNFVGVPIVQENIPAASIGVVTVDHTNKWNLDGRPFEQYNTIATSVVAPSMGAGANGGLNIGTLTAANAKEIEITQGNSIAIKNAFLAGTSPAFYVRATFRVPVLNVLADLSVGFRIVQTYAATPYTNYTDYASIGILGATGELETQTRVASAAAVITDTTNAATAATNFTLQVNVSAAGAVTYLWGNANGPLVAPTTTVAATMGAVTMIPWIHSKMAAGANGEVDLVSYSCGLL
jgi:hypothetical protein